MRKNGVVHCVKTSFGLRRRRIQVRFSINVANTQRHRAGQGLTRTSWFRPSQIIGDSTYRVPSEFAVYSDDFPSRECSTLHHECRRIGASTSRSAQCIDVMSRMRNETLRTPVQLYTFVCVLFFAGPRATFVSMRNNTQRYVFRGSQTSIRMALRANGNSQTNSGTARTGMALCLSKSSC